MIWGRVLTAMITPFRETGEIHYDEAARLARYLSEQGSDTLVVCGTTGESPTLTWDEEYTLFQVVRDAVTDRPTQVIAGTGSNSTREAVEATRKAAKLGLDGSLQVVPYYNKPSQAGLYQHFKQIADSSDLPVLLYNVPGRTSAHLNPETVARLAEHPSVLGIKEASGNMDAVSQIRRLTPEAFRIYAGDDSLTLPTLALGGTGVVSVASHLVGTQLQNMISSYTSGKTGDALKTHLSLFPLFRGLFLETNPVPVKTALRWQGWQVGEVREPLVPLSDSSQQRLREILTTFDLIPAKKVSDVSEPSSLAVSS